jgi:hypothetical protein
LEPADAAPELGYGYWFGARGKAIAGDKARELATVPPLRAGAEEAWDPRISQCSAPVRIAASYTLECRFDRAGVLVIAEAWFPNWRVFVNDEERASLRINHAFQGAEVEPGTATIRFEQEVTGLTHAGMLVSTFGWLSALVALAVLTFKQRRVVANSN